MDLIPNDELSELLERNGYPGAAENLYATGDQRASTAYIAGNSPYYDDGEGRWLQDYIDRLHNQANAQDDLREQASNLSRGPRPWTERNN